MANARWLIPSLALVSATSMAAGIGPLPTQTGDSVFSAEVGYYYQRTDWEGINGSLASDALDDITRDAPYLRLSYLFHPNWQASFIMGDEGISNNANHQFLDLTDVDQQTFFGAQLSGIVYQDNDFSVGPFLQYTSHGDYSFAGEYEQTTLQVNEYAVNTEDLTDLTAGVMLQKDFQTLSVYGGVFYQDLQTDFSGYHTANTTTTNLNGTLEADTNLGGLVGVSFMLEPHLNLNLEYQNRGNHGIAISMVYHFQKPKPEVVVVETTRTVIIQPEVATTYDATVYFDVGKTDLKDSELAKLRGVVRFIEDNPNAQVVIEGHCDCTGPESFNQKLSDERAAKVREVLVKYYGVSEDRILQEGLGEALPAETNDTDEGRSHNRRVRIYASK